MSIEEDLIEDAIHFKQQKTLDCRKTQTSSINNAPTREDSRGASGEDKLLA